MARLTATRKLTSHGQNLHGRLSAIAGARRRLIAECSDALISNGKTRVELSTIEGGGLGLFAVEPLPSGSIVPSTLVSSGRRTTFTWTRR